MPFIVIALFMEQFTSRIVFNLSLGTNIESKVDG